MKLSQLTILFAFAATSACFATVTAEDSFADASGDSSVQQKGGKTLIWSDEFNGNQINTQNWNHVWDGQGGGNDELQFYTSNSTNSYVKDGLLHIVAQKEEVGGRQYTSARLNTKGHYGFLHGLVEVRAKLPQGKGIWPAIWMFPENPMYGDWPKSGAVGIVQAKGSEPNLILGTIDYGDAWPNNRDRKFVSQNKNSFSDEFHTYSILWEPKRITWYVDGQAFGSISDRDLGDCGNGPCPWRFDQQQFHFVMNLAVGGRFPGAPDESTQFPQELVVDYVRLYRVNKAQQQESSQISQTQSLRG